MPCTWGNIVSPESSQVLTVDPVFSLATIAHFKGKPAQPSLRSHKANIWPSWVRNLIYLNPKNILNTLNIGD